MFKKITFFLLISQIAFAQQSMFSANNKKQLNTSASTTQQSIITGGLLLNLDASSSISYGGSGSTWSDLSGANNHATLSGNPVYIATAPGYFTFSGNNDAHLNFSWPTDFTCSFWIYPISAPGGGFSRIFSTGPSDNFEIAINSANQISYYSSTVSWQSNKVTVSANTWNQVVFTKSGGTLQIYINGVNAYTSNLSNTSGSSLYIGRRYNTSEGVNLRMGSVLIYNRAITGLEVSSNWNGQKSRFGL